MAGINTKNIDSEDALDYVLGGIDQDGEGGTRTQKIAKLAVQVEAFLPDPTYNINVADSLSAVSDPIASASETDLSAATGVNVTITGTTTIESFGTIQAGAHRYLTFSGVLIINHNATSLILPAAGNNITTAVGDTALVMSLGDGNWHILNYTKVNGKALISPTLFGGSGVNDALFAAEIAAFKPSSLGLADGIADSYSDESDVDTGLSSNQFYYSDTRGYTSTGPRSDATTLGPTLPAGAFNYTNVNRSLALTNGSVISKLGFYCSAAISSKLKIVRRNSAGNYDILLSEEFDHTGGGWKDLELSTLFVVPASGDFYIATYSASGIDLMTEAPRALLTGDITGNSASFVEASSSSPTPVRVNYLGIKENMVLVSQVLNAIAEPDTVRFAVQVIEADAATVNVDFTLEVSRDGGTTWTMATLVQTSITGTVKMYEAGDIDMYGQPSGTSMVYRFKTLNNKMITIVSVVFQWS